LYGSVVHGCVAVLSGAYLDYQYVAVAKLVLEVLRTAETFELAIHHDRYLRTQGVTFLHTGKPEKNCSAVDVFVHLNNLQHFQTFVFSVFKLYSDQSRLPVMSA